MALRDTMKPSGKPKTPDTKAAWKTMTGKDSGTGAFPSLIAEHPDGHREIYKPELYRMRIFRMIQPVMGGAAYEEMFYNEHNQLLKKQGGERITVTREQIDELLQAHQHVPRQKTPEPAAEPVKPPEPMPIPAFESIRSRLFLADDRAEKRFSEEALAELTMAFDEEAKRLGMFEKPDAELSEADRSVLNAVADKLIAAVRERGVKPADEPRTAKPARRTGSPDAAFQAA